MGDELLSEGKLSKVAYLILEGEVEVRVGARSSNPHTVARLGKGEVIGELSMLDDDVPTATVVATRETKVSILTRDQFQSRLDNMDPVMKGVLRVLIRRIRALMAEKAEVTGGQSADWGNWNR
jgi:CRP-like cAMP-binding protein